MLVFSIPVVFSASAIAPMAVFLLPVVLELSVPYPLAVLPEPVVLATSASVAAGSVVVARHRRVAGEAEEGVPIARSCRSRMRLLPI